MADNGDLGAEKLRDATLREREQAGIEAANYYYPPGWGEAIDCAWAVGPFDCNTARADSETALASAQAEFPNLEGHNDKADAYRHCYWNALMAVHIGADQAKEVGDLHENNNPNPPGERAMDLHNNAVGRGLGASNEAEAKSMSLAAANDGRLQLAP